MEGDSQEDAGEDTPMSYLRDYQIEACKAINTELSNGSRSTLAVMPTGCGKTELALEVADQWPQGEILFLSHRQELVFQPAERWERKTGHHAEIVMGEFNASGTYGRSKFISGSVQTLCRENRLTRAFPDPDRVGLIIVDEAHHATKANKSYRAILEYFLRNQDCRVLGITATPDRADEKALGETFDSVAFEYPIFDPHGGPSAIGDGWLVPIHQEYITVEEIDFDSVATRGGDFVDASLERQLVSEKVLHRMTSPLREIAGDRKTLGFTAGIEQAIKCAEIMNRYAEANAMAIASRIPSDMGYGFVIDSGDMDQRRRHLKRYSAGEFQFLFNMGIFLEGYDEPAIGVVSCGRPTKSRALHCQMVGRGTRILRGVIERDGWRCDSPEERKRLIAESAKPNLCVIDFVGNSRHALISAVDILAGHYTDEVVARAKAKTKAKGGDAQEALAEAEEEIRKELEHRKRIQARATFRRTKIDPFQALDVVPINRPGYYRKKEATQGQKELLLKFKLEQDEIANLDRWNASQLIGQLIERRRKNLCSYKQAKLLAKFGERTDVPFEYASERIDKIAKNGWKPLPDAGMEREPGAEG